MAIIPVENPLVKSYILYSAILALKLLALGPMTAAVRLTKGIFANPEDARIHPKGKVKLDDNTIERIRRAHLNDLENITPFWVIAAFYISTGPSVTLATILFRVFTATRILHTIVYAVIPLPQPTRAIACVVPYLIMWYMGLQVLFYYFSAV